MTDLLTWRRFCFLLVLGTSIVFQSVSVAQKPTKEEGEAALRKALAEMEKMCEKCCPPADQAKCKAEAKAIVDAIVAAWNANYGNGSNESSDNVGGYLCWDWARFFRDSALATNPTGWTVEHGMADKKGTPAEPANGVVHYWVSLYPCGNREDTCKVMIDDGWMNAGVLVHVMPWPNPERWQPGNDPIPPVTPKKTGPDELAGIGVIVIVFTVLLIIRRRRNVLVTSLSGIV